MLRLNINKQIIRENTEGFTCLLIIQALYKIYLILPAGKRNIYERVHYV